MTTAVDLLSDLDLSKYAGGIGVTLTTVRPESWQERWRWQPITAYSPGIEPFFGAVFKQKPLVEISVDVA
ncbi:hypothetical protein HOU02_gp071 [Caulobacter phage CcrBL9]|uniref:Uncharacterized protein n=1 Tax=Caulobacter phage CcrBL9 TaxID=2283270 RepID=A0A385EDK9_9CAUD|nr:hypothetical protein HOU02_gp071 [Caulobacter phage CcrBL9]AXQ69095.1 hypothetical protein CcrBL9_gp071c [Caulobacter phage CcrBL9]